MAREPVGARGRAALFRIPTGQTHAHARVFTHLMVPAAGVPVAIAAVEERVDAPASLLHGHCWVPRDFIRFATMVYSGTKFTIPQAEAAFFMLLAYASSDQTPSPEAMRFLMAKIWIDGIQTDDDDEDGAMERIQMFAKKCLDIQFDVVA